MKYLSVCSGVEAATVAWHHMGWNPVAFSEIGSVHPRFYLSPKACSGILRRAEVRGKQLPQALKVALQMAIQQSEHSSPETTKE